MNTPASFAVCAASHVASLLLLWCVRIPSATAVVPDDSMNTEVLKFASITYVGGAQESEFEILKLRPFFVS